MKKKTARRFLSRNRWKIARQEAGVKGESPSFNKRVHAAMTTLGDPRFRIFNFLKK